MAEMRTSPDGQRPGLGERLTGLLEDVGGLLARHAELISSEVRRSARGALTGVLLLLAGAFLLVFATGLLLVAALLVLSAVLRVPAWAATLIVVGVAVIVAAVLLLLASRQLRRIGLPVTRRALKEDAEWLRTLTRSPDR